MYHASKQFDIYQTQREVDQLKIESKIVRKNVSECVTDLIQYAEQNALDDPLLNKLPANENPFRERNRGCLLF